MTARWRAGIGHLDLPADAAVPAPASGVTLGAGRDGPLTLRLFRASGTRVIVLGDPGRAHLLALRTASAGTAVHVVTEAPQLWEPVVAHGPGSRVHRPGADVLTAPGPALLVDECTDRPRTDARPWQCCVEIRSEWTAADLGSFTSADVTVFGRMPSETTLRIAALYGIAPSATEPMTGLHPQAVALVRRGRVEYAELQLSAAEAQVLERARRQLAASRIAP